MEKPPLLPDETKARALAIRQLCAELRQNRAFTWFIGEMQKLADEANQIALDEQKKGKERKRGMHRHHAFMEAVKHIEAEDLQARGFLGDEE